MEYVGVLWCRFVAHMGVQVLFRWLVLRSGMITDWTKSGD